MSDHLKALDDWSGESILDDLYDYVLVFLLEITPGRQAQSSLKNLIWETISGFVWIVVMPLEDRLQM